MNGLEETAATVRSIKANASALGLTWNLRLGTVTTAGSVPSVLLDGDEAGSTSLLAISLVGATVKGARVMTLWIPPNTLYIIGAPGGAVAREITNRIYQQGSSNLTLNTTDTLVPGCLVTLSTVGAAQWEVAGVYDFGQTVAGAPTFSGTLYVDGVAQTALAVMLPAAAAVARQTTPQNWSGSFAAGGVHTFELRASVSAVTGTSVVRGTSTTILVKTYE